MILIPCKKKKKEQTKKGEKTENICFTIISHFFTLSLFFEEVRVSKHNTLIMKTLPLGESNSQVMS